MIVYYWQHCRLPFLYFAEFADFGVVENKVAVECRESGVGKVNHDHTIVDKRLRPDILGGYNKVASVCFEVHGSVLHSDGFVAGIILLSFEMSDFIEILRSKLVGKDPSNFGRSASQIAAPWRSWSLPFRAAETALEVLSNYPIGRIRKFEEKGYAYIGESPTEDSHPAIRRLLSSTILRKNLPARPENQGQWRQNARP